jgi:antitoxin component YwqK of YwqJK toxin-antitoxin module
MNCFSPRSGWIAGSVPAAICAMGIGFNVMAAEQSPLKMPRNYAEAGPVAAHEPTAIHTDLGVMGEIELVRERYPDGAIKIERQTTLDRDGNYVNHGAWKMFTPKGDVIAEGQYQFGQRTGLWIRWHGRNDSPLFNEFPFNQFKAPYMSQASFTNGVLDGEWIITDASDHKCSQISLKNGKRHGMAITWLPNGKVLRQATYEDGVPVGELLEANSRTGELERAATFVEGRRLITRTTEYPGRQQKKTETTYLAAPTVEQSSDEFWNVRMAKYATEGSDLRHGLARAWYANGQPEQEGAYQYGKKTGTFTFWHENGQVAATGEYRDDQPVGLWVWWHENGQKSAIGRYQRGLLTGEWRWWDEAGKLTKQHIYDGTESADAQSEKTYEVSERDTSDDLEHEPLMF